MARVSFSLGAGGDGEMGVRAEYKNAGHSAVDREEDGGDLSPRAGIQVTSGSGPLLLCSSKQDVSQ